LRATDRVRYKSGSEIGGLASARARVFDKGTHRQGRYMTRRGLSALGLMGCAAALIAAPGASAAPTGHGCKLDAVANFGSTPLKVGKKPFGFTLTGALTECRSDPGVAAAGPAGASIQIGGIYTAPNGHQYRQPAGSGNGSCADTTTSGWTGTAIVRWNGGGVTLVPLGVTSFGPVSYLLAGPAAAAVQLEPVDPKDDPLIVQTTAYAGNSAAGAAALQLSPADCAGAGVASAPLTGAFGVYK
jgi:hypothetical protein